MQALDSTGEFWLPGPHGVKQHGKIVFNPFDRTSLTLDGPLVERMAKGVELEEVREARPRILGAIVDGGVRVPVTLINCRLAHRTAYWADSILIGGNFDDRQEIEFEEVVIRLRDAAPWINKEAITVEVDSTVDGDDGQLVCRLSLPGSRQAPFSRGKVSLDFRRAREAIDLESITARYWPEFSIKYDKMTPLAEIIKDAGNLHSLSSLCVDRLDSFLEILVYRSDRPLTTYSGKPIEDTKRPIEFKARMHEPGRQFEAKRLDAHRVPIPFDDFGGVEAVAKWLDRPPGIGPIIGAMLTMRTQSMYGENRFLNVSSAAEGLHRVLVGKGRVMHDRAFDDLRRAIRSEMVPLEYHEWFNNVMAHANDFDLDRRLRDLIAQLGVLSELLIGENSEQWIAAVKKARNGLTHFDKNRKEFDGGDLYWLAESLFQVSRIFLLTRFGLSADQLPKIVRHVHGWSGALRLQGALDRIMGSPALADEASSS